MNDKAAIWFPIGVMLLLAALTYWLEQSVQPAPPKRDGSHRHDPDYIVDKFSATRLGANGTPAYTLAAGKMTHYPDDDSTHLEQPNFTSFKSGKPPMHITGNTALVSSNGEHVYFTGNVRVTRDAAGSNSQLTLLTPYLHIIPDKAMALTDKAVDIRDAHMHVTAIGLELNNDNRTLKLLSRVKVHYDKSK